MHNYYLGFRNLSKVARFKYARLPLNIYLIKINMLQYAKGLCFAIKFVKKCSMKNQNQKKYFERLQSVCDVEIVKNSFFVFCWFLRPNVGMTFINIPTPKFPKKLTFLERSNSHNNHKLSRREICVQILFNL